MNPIKLQYLKNSRQINSWMSDPAQRRMWNIVTPSHPRFKGTFPLPALIELGVVPQPKQEVK